jgi:hypothetical protein
LAQVLNDLLLHFFATRTPTASPGELFDAAAQTVKAQHLRRMAEPGAQFMAEAREEKQLQAIGGLAGEMGEVCFMG